MEETASVCAVRSEILNLLAGEIKSHTLSPLMEEVVLVANVKSNNSFNPLSDEMTEGSAFQSGIEHDPSAFPATITVQPLMNAPPSMKEAIAVSALTEICSTEIEDNPNQQTEDACAVYVSTEICSTELSDNSSSLADKGMSDAAIRLLISTYFLHYQNKTPAAGKKHVWQQVHKEFKAQGYLLTMRQLMNKWHTLERAFKRVVQTSRKPGQRPVTCNYQSELEELVTQCPDIFPKFVSGSRKRKSRKTDEMSSSYENTNDEYENSSPSMCLKSKSEKNSRRFSIRRAAERRKHVAVEKHSSSSSSSDSSDRSITVVSSQEMRPVAEELAKLKETVKHCADKKKRQIQLHHTEKMKFVREVMSLPPPQKVTRNYKTIDRRRKIALLFALL